MNKKTIHEKLMLSLVFFKLKNILDLLTKKKTITSIHKETILSNKLQSFKIMLIILTNKNESHRPVYIEKLSQTWNSLNNVLPATRVNTTLPKEIKLQNLIESIQNTPPGEDYSLGYYLSEHVGQAWAPFPFMNILDTLHKDYLTFAEKSTLGFWIATIQEIQDSLSL